MVCDKVIEVLTSLRSISLILSSWLANHGDTAIASLAFCAPLTRNSGAVGSRGLCLGAAEGNPSVPQGQRPVGSVPPASEVVWAPLCSGGTSWRCSVEEHFLHVDPDGEPTEREREESFIKATVT